MIVLNTHPSKTLDVLCTLGGPLALVLLFLDHDLLGLALVNQRVQVVDLVHGAVFIPSLDVCLAVAIGDEVSRDILMLGYLLGRQLVCPKSGHNL